MFDNGISVRKLIDMDFEEYEEYLDKKIKKDSFYNEKVQEFQDICDKETDKKTALKLDASCVAIETAARDIAFDEGFKLGVKFILSCIKGGVCE